MEEFAKDDSAGRYSGIGSMSAPRTGEHQAGANLPSLRAGSGSYSGVSKLLDRNCENY